MAEQHIITKLEDKRKELSRLVTVKERELSRARSDSRALDSTIRLYNPDHELPIIGARRPLAGISTFISRRSQKGSETWHETGAAMSPPSGNNFTYTITKDKDMNYDNLDVVSHLAFYRAVSRGLAQSRRMFCW